VNRNSVQHYSVNMSVQPYKGKKSTKDVWEYRYDNGKGRTYTEKLSTSKSQSGTVRTQTQKELSVRKANGGNETWKRTTTVTYGGQRRK